MRTVLSQVTKWRARHARTRRVRDIQRAIDAVSPGTLQDEVAAFARTQFNR
jgi:hypothetical protein